MNYYEQFYDDLEFYDEEETEPYGHDQHDPGYGYEDTWVHRDEMYRHHGRGARRDQYSRYAENSRYFVRGYGGRERDEWESHRGRGRGYSDRGWSPRNRGRGFANRGRGNVERGRPGQRGRGAQRGSVKGFPAMNFVKASEPTGLESSAPATSKPEQTSDKTDGEDGTVTTAPLPVLSSYGYGPGSDFQGFGSISTESGPITNYQAADPGVPGLENEIVTPPQSSVPPTNTTSPPQKPAPKVVTAVVKPMYNFVKAQSEFKSTDVAFHEIEKGNIQKGSGLAPSTAPQTNIRVGVGAVPGQKLALQTFDIATAFHAGAKDGCNPRFDDKFNKLRDAMKVCNAPGKNSIEVIHMAVDKVKMKITDIQKPGGRTPYGQAMFSCKLEIDGVFVAEGSATNKKAAKHEAYNKAKLVLEGGPLTVVEAPSGVFELKQKHVAQSPSEAVQKTSAQSTPIQQSVPTRNVAATTNTKYNKPQIIFHKSTPMSDTNNSNQAFIPQQSTEAAGQLATQLLNFVKEGTSQSGPPCVSTYTYPEFKKPAVPRQSAQPLQKRTPDQNMLKRALHSVNTDRFRAKKQRCGPMFLEDLSQFVILDSSMMHPNLSDISILHASANHNKVLLKFEYEVLGKADGYQFLCSTYLGEHNVSSTKGCSKETSKINAAKEALDHLREICYSIKVKQDVDNDTEGMTKNDLLSDGKINEAIPDNNIGNKMLRKMGWVGGGMGRDGSGIAEPVKTEMIIGREGLGLKAEKGIGKDFEKRVTSMLTDYIKDDEQRDLHFSSELEKEERAVIHQIGQKLGLKTQSKGKGNNRYLIVSRRRSVGELLEHILSSGGSTNKYEVVPPTNSDVDPRRRDAFSYGHCKQ